MELPCCKFKKVEPLTTKSSDINKLPVKYASSFLSKKLVVSICSAFNAYDAVIANEELNTVIEAVSDARINEPSSTIISSIFSPIMWDADTAYDDEMAENTEPITLLPLITPEITLPPLPITTLPLVKSANVTRIVSLSIISISDGSIIDSEPVS